MTRKSPKPPKPTAYQSQILAIIARSGLVKTHDASRPVPIWTVDGREISNECAQALIRKGWVLPNRDGLGIYDDAQTYRALKA